MLMYIMEGNDVSFCIPNNFPTFEFTWANDMEECSCPPSSIIVICACNVNRLSLPLASYSEDAINFTSLTVQANNTKVYLVNSTMNRREICKAYQIIIILGKCISKSGFPIVLL